MFQSLSPGAIGVKVANLEAALALAARHGFRGCHFGIGEAADLGAARVQDLAAAQGVRLSAFGLPVNFRGAEADFVRDLAALPRLAQAAAALGVRRCATWVAPASDELPYADNFALHARRLRAGARTLADSGIRLGLEYVGPDRSRKGKKHGFIHTMDQMAELCAAAGRTCGYLLDAWHWYTARESAGHLLRLAPEQVVDVHVNDAPAKPLGQQVDDQRTLPGETGVIDIAGFLGCLRQIGYDGPVMVEPFSQRVRDLAPDAACAATKAALDKVWAQAGLA